MKKVLTICGSGVATSVMCANKIKQFCEKNGIDVEVKAISFGQLDPKSVDADCIVSVNPNLSIDVDVPVISGVSLLTGMGQEQTLQSVVDVLKRGAK
ncbi:PTS sugar transporter subunit IIB [Anaeropeptidivorans aminofermentans]|jgi:PTS system galactitol-specific IIB component|uniref:PTS sugar transporter subunit IIB n=1 Tax=Anaeropeptidivorans aminofermentans TaxID=2934315 RepID=UPI002023C35D|nr:PTS sugar transporter subunit IIB [Anaeropeptidivorans aminofermentans]MBE6011300.1 PTS galactitol transporter subunit IIB [Lachnospiraceae bacterium]